MLTETKAHKIALQTVPRGLVIDSERVRELENGWLFPYSGDTGVALFDVPVGSNGVIVNKSTGAVYKLGSAYEVDRDARFYDLGYRNHIYDLVVLSVADRSATIDLLRKLAVSEVEIKYEHGTVWRIPRALSQKELVDRIQVLPCVFPEMQLYFSYELLEEARAKGTLEFEALECPANVRTATESH